MTEIFDELNNSNIHETITYQDIVKSIGGRKIQQGMNYRVNSGYSVFLMNTSSKSNYYDKYEEGILTYEGHDIQSRNSVNPKTIDQPERNRNGSLTANGKFYLAATKYKTGQVNEPEYVRVYEKLEKDVWIDRGFFSLVDARKENARGRVVFKFRLIPKVIEQVSEAEIDKAIADNDEFIVKEVLATESKRITTIRNGQNAIRKQTLRNYSYQCAMCDIDDSEMLVASHIIPWAEDKSYRGLSENVICLCVLHDALFEQGKITITDNFEIQFSDYFLNKCLDKSGTYYAIKQNTKAHLKKPKAFIPTKELLTRHRDTFLVNRT